MRYERAACSRLLISGALLFATNPVYASEWSGSASLYFWLPSIDASGNLNVPPNDGSGEDPLPVDPNQVLDSLDLALMGSFEVRYDKYLFLTDIAYLDMSNTKSVNILNTSREMELGFEGWQSSYYGGYAVVGSDELTVDIIAGLRYFSMEFEVEVDRNNIVKQRKRTFYEGLLDGVIGLKGQYNITNQWFIPYHADVGTGNSDLTYQLIGGVGYGGGWGDVELTYRHLAWHLKDNSILNTFSLSGFSIAYGYNF
ncbi:hypothetical protein [Moritella sp. Urea-trap-13]|uniref:hypothetical protein n=1 Tax=Moritella sp. Urea-trap-13 TaxID=2058327 RepID=UPI000C33148D|nr:hypothetical protein [Moritella sp. Urea-trap-13]PKH06136.1 hypothetical protein CXF93_09385 [Moritella sp. Urea-trap-13]